MMAAAIRITDRAMAREEAALGGRVVVVGVSEMGISVGVPVVGVPLVGLVVGVAVGVAVGTSQLVPV